jgi:hypothetical protein
VIVLDLLYIVLVLALFLVSMGMICIFHRM